MKNKMKIVGGPQDVEALVDDLQKKLKVKHEHLAATRLRLQRAKSEVHRLKGIIAYQRDYLLKVNLQSI